MYFVFEQASALKNSSGYEIRLCQMQQLSPQGRTLNSFSAKNSQRFEWRLPLDKSLNLPNFNLIEFLKKNLLFKVTDQNGLEIDVEQHSIILGPSFDLFPLLFDFQAKFQLNIPLISLNSESTFLRVIPNQLSNISSFDILFLSTGLYFFLTVLRIALRLVVFFRLVFIERFRKNKIPRYMDIEYILSKVRHFVVIQ